MREKKEQNKIKLLSRRITFRMSDTGPLYRSQSAGIVFHSTVRTTAYRKPKVSIVSDIQR